MDRDLAERCHFRPPLPEAYWQLMAQAEQLVLYSLLPSLDTRTPSSDRFHCYPVLGQLQVVDAGRKSAVCAVLRAGAEAGAHGYPCWQPHHGVGVLRGGEALDLVICFTSECMQVFVNPQSVVFEWASISGGPEAALDQWLTEAGVPLAPRERHRD